MPSDGDGHLVLYIDDKADNDVLVRRILGRRPSIELVTARNGREGVTKALRQRPNLILLDLNLPDISGREVLAQLRDEPITRPIPVVIVTAEAAPARIERLMEEGARAYFAMPYDVAEFLATIDALLGIG